jgi:hypothetical protein
VVLSQAHWKALIHLVKYVVDTKLRALHIRPNKFHKGIHLEGISDSEFAGDHKTRVSIDGYVVYFCGAPTSWKSKSSKSVTPSSTEAEYYAVSETSKELMFIYNHLQEMKLGRVLQLQTIFENGKYWSNLFGKQSLHFSKN